MAERWTHWFYRNVPFWTPSESTRKVLQWHGVREIHVFPNGTDTIPLADLEPKQLKLPLRLVVVSRFSLNSGWTTQSKPRKFYCKEVLIFA